MREKIFELTPLGKADNSLNKYMEGEDDLKDKEEYKDYRKALSRYRDLKLFQIVVKILLYAGLVTSVAASVGIRQLELINRLASYLGVTVIIIAFIAVNYFTMLQREDYHVKREILISNTSIALSDQSENSEK